MKAKTYEKTTLVIVAFLLIIATSMSLGLVAKSDKVAKAQVEDEYDVVFYETLSVLTPTSLDGLGWNRSVIYDLSLCALGYVYDFIGENVQGYAILIEDRNGISLVEMAFDEANPYEGADGLNVYLTSFTYANYVNGFYNLAGLLLTEEQLKALYPNHHRGLSTLTPVPYEINYASKTETEYSLAKRIPSYVDPNSSLSTCAVVAGTNLIAYHDRFATNLIANYTPGSGLGSMYVYKTQNATINALHNQLYVDMGTNTAGVGTTVSQFMVGMNTYCVRQGYTANFSRCDTNGALNWQSAKVHIDGGRPLVLFTSEIEISNLEEQTNEDYYDAFWGSDNHAVVAFGYREVDYTKGDNSVQNAKYLYVATGNSQITNGYLNVSNNFNLYEAYAVSIQ